MTKEGIRFTFDYVDPGSYLTHTLLGRWTREGLPVPGLEWIPLELRPLPAPPLDMGAPAWAAMVQAMEREAEAMGIPFRPPGTAPRTRKAHELALHAGERDRFDAVHEALFRAHFQEGRDLGRVDILVELAVESGLDGPEVRTVLGVDRFLPRLLDLRTRSLEGGIRGVPTLERGAARMEGFQGAGALRDFLLAGPPPHPTPHPREGDERPRDNLSDDGRE